MQTIMRNKSQKMTKMSLLSLLTFRENFESNMHEAADFYKGKLGLKQA